MMLFNCVQKLEKRGENHGVNKIQTMKCRKKNVLKNRRPVGKRKQD